MNHPKPEDLPEEFRTREAVLAASDPDLEHLMGLCPAEPAEPKTCLACLAFMELQERDQRAKLAPYENLAPGLYDLIRTTDQTGVSGTGRVAQVVVFEDRSAATKWMTGKDSMAFWPNVEDMLDVHIRCHPDTTKLVRVSL